MSRADDLVHNLDYATMVANECGRGPGTGLRNCIVFFNILFLIAFLILNGTQVLFVVIDIAKCHLFVAKDREEAKDGDEMHACLDVNAAHNLATSHERFATIVAD